SLFYSLLLFFFSFFFYCYRYLLYLHSFPTRRSSDLSDLFRLLNPEPVSRFSMYASMVSMFKLSLLTLHSCSLLYVLGATILFSRSEEHTSELQSRFDLVCRLLLEKKNIK